jgi:hypothetical protein
MLHPKRMSKGGFEFGIAIRLIAATGRVWPSGIDLDDTSRAMAGTRKAQALGLDR